MSLEAAVIIDKDHNPIYWHIPPDRSAGYLPDSAELWAKIWENRDKIWAIAHSHPGQGIPYPSSEDFSTFRAVSQGLGRDLEWIIISETDGIIVKADEYKYTAFTLSRVQLDSWPWVAELKRVSYGLTSEVVTPTIADHQGENHGEY